MEVLSPFLLWMDCFHWDCFSPLTRCLTQCSGAPCWHFWHLNFSPLCSFPKNFRGKARSISSVLSRLFDELIPLHTIYSRQLKSAYVPTLRAQALLRIILPNMKFNSFLQIHHHTSTLTSSYFWSLWKGICRSGDIFGLEILTQHGMLFGLRLICAPHTTKNLTAVKNGLCKAGNNFHPGSIDLNKKFYEIS